MANYLSYVQENGKSTFNRAYRETLIFQMINHFEQNYVPDSAEGVDGYERKYQTIAQKRRLRNQIIREASDYVNSYNTTHDDKVSINDTDVIVDAFFKTPYGQLYAGKKSDWEAGADVRENHVNNIRTWTNGQDMTAIDVRRVTISPYDPMFSNSDLFDDKHDEIGYIIGSMNADGSVHLNANGRPHIDMVAGNPKGYIRGVYLGKNHTIADWNDRVDIVNQSEVQPLESELASVGYYDVSRFIKTKKAQTDVRNYLMKYASSDSTYRVSDDQRQFMSDVCNYLTDNGIDFNVEMSTDNHVIAKLEGTRSHIRLLDVEEPQYQGRIYDEGRLAYLSSVKIHQVETDGKMDIITNRDRLDMIKWYFGTEPVMARDEKIKTAENRNHGFSNLQVGEERLLEGLSAPTNRRSKTNRVEKSTTTKRAALNKYTESSSILLASKSVTDDAGNRLYDVPINIQLTSSAYDRMKESPEVIFALSIEARKDDFINRPSLIIERIPEDKILAGDIITNEEGQKTWAPNAVVGDDSKIKYYQHVIANDKLRQWVDSAKESYSEAVDIDAIFAKADEYAVNKDVQFAYSSDDAVCDLQEIYWKVLTQNSDFEVDGTVIPKSMSIDDRKAFVENHLNNYLEENFGTVPDIPHHSIFVDNTGKGFNPEKVAKYVATPDAQGVQKNYDYIRHMLSRLEDDYNPDYIKGDTYIGNEIKKDLIKYDDTKEIARIHLAELDARGDRFWDNPAFDRLNNMPVTKEMLMHTANTLARSGFDRRTVTVSVDENGVIKYRGIQTVEKSPAPDLDRYTRFGSVKNSDDETFIDTMSAPGYEVCIGQIGQIFEPDDLGVIHTKYAVPDNKVLVPGYDAYLVQQDPDNPESMRDRLRLSDWQQQMKQVITKEIHRASFSQPREYNFVPKSTSLNTVYRHTYDMVFTEDEYQSRLPRDMNNPTPEEQTFLSVIETLRGRCRFPNEYGEGSTTMAQSMLEHPTRDEARDYDYYYSDLNDNKNLRVLDETYDGIFDPDLTGTAKTQGLVRYLAEGVTVDSNTGKVTAVDYTPGEHAPQCKLMKDDLFKYKDFNTWDRREMAGSQLITSLGTPRNVGVAMMNCYGWNVDDGFIVSKSFADAHPVLGAPDKDGHREYRSLMIQDKLSDMNGNKGVIACVVDPELASDVIAQKLAIDRLSDTTGLDLEDSKLTSTTILFDGKQYNVEFDKKSKGSHAMQAAYHIQKELGVHGMDNLMHLFRDNENLEVVMSPYSPMSRFNGGSIKELMRDNEDGIISGMKDLKLGDKTIEGGMGYMNLIVVDMLADVKTHFYDEDAIKEGKGRKASGQLAWALQSKGATKIMDEFFGDNQSAFDDMREYLIAVGLDMDTKAEMQIGYHPQVDRGEYRALIPLPENTSDVLQMAKDNKLNAPNALPKLHPDKTNEYTSELLQTLNETGGFMELPFKLNFNTTSYVDLPKAVQDEWFDLPKTGRSYETSDGKSHETYGMPVLPQGLRSGQDYLDGTTRAHDYTNRYVDIYKQALLYKACEEKLLDPDISDAARYNLQNKMESCQESAQTTFNKVTQDIMEHRFKTKHNIIRDGVMANRLSNSATAVWSADPRLDIDEVSMSTDHAKQLGIMNEDGEWLDKDGGRILVWRDPILHDSNVRYMRVAINDNLTGVAINPLAPKCFDGDFDGDSVALAAFKSKESKAQAFTKFSFETNMLNKGVKTMVKDPRTGEEVSCYPIYVTDGLDCKSNAYVRPELQERFDRLTIDINRLEAKASAFEKGEIDASEISVDVKVRAKGEDGEFKKNEQGRPVYETQTRTGKAAINYLRRRYFKELNSWAHDSLDGIATDHVIVKDEKTVMESLQHIVDTGAKGSQSKLHNVADNIGVDFETGEDGRVDISTVRKIEKDGVHVPRGMYDGNQREIDKQIQETAAYKADNTALGGTTAQQGVAAFRDVDLEAALELTYPITQAILQSKHDPKDAKVKDEIVRFWGKDIWNGYKLTGDWTLDDPTAIQNQAHERVTQYAKGPDGNFIQRKERVPETTVDGEPLFDENGNRKHKYEPMVDENGKPVYERMYVKCTKDEWVAQMKGMMTALKVDVNPEYIDRLADVMTRTEPTVAVSSYDNKPILCQNPSNWSEINQVKPASTVGTVAGLEDYAKENGSLLDKAAYAEKATALVKAALAGHDGYQEAVKNSKIPVNQKETSSRTFATGVVEGMSQCKAIQESLAEASTAKEARQIRTEMSNARTNVPNSGSFVPNPFKNEILNDMVRAETGAEDNVRIKVKNGETIEIHTAPRPVGRKDSFVTQAKVDELGITSMSRPCPYAGKESETVAEANVSAPEVVVVEKSTHNKSEASAATIEARVAKADSTLNIDTIQVNAEKASKKKYGGMNF